MKTVSARFLRFGALASVAVSTVLVLGGCTPASQDPPTPSGTDMWANEPIGSVDAAKRTSVNILNKLAGLARDEHKLPSESQAPEPGTTPLRLLSCDEPNHFMYPGATAVLFDDKKAAKEFETTATDFLRTQNGWHEQSVTDASGNTKPQFVSSNGFAVSVRYREHRGEHIVGITAFSPCFEMPEDFNYNVKRF